MIKDGIPSVRRYQSKGSGGTGRIQRVSLASLPNSAVNMRS